MLDTRYEDDRPTHQEGLVDWTQVEHIMEGHTITEAGNAQGQEVGVCKGR